MCKGAARGLQLLAPVCATRVSAPGLVTPTLGLPCIPWAGQRPKVKEKRTLPPLALLAPFPNAFQRAGRGAALSNVITL